MLRGPGATVRVGRAPENDIQVISPYISRRHAELKLTEAGVKFRDLRSTSGSYLDGRRITDVLLFPGMSVRLGSPDGIRLNIQAPTGAGIWPAPQPSSGAHPAVDLVDVPEPSPNDSGPMTEVLRAARSEEEVAEMLGAEEARGLAGAALDAEIERTLGRVDPLRLAPYLDPARTLMVQARFDRVVPYRLGTKVWQAAGRPERVSLLTGHYSAAVMLPYLQQLTKAHFLRQLR